MSRSTICRPFFQGLLLIGFVSALGVQPAGAVSLEWVRQLGTSTLESSYGISSDGLGNVYISGQFIDGVPINDSNAFVSKFDSNGDVVWTRQVGTSGGDHSRGVSADGLGNVYIVGDTNGNLGAPHAGGGDAFVSKIDDGGNLLWSRQLGTAFSEEGHAVSADGMGNVYIAGQTAGSLAGPVNGFVDAFISRFDSDGNALWTQQLGASLNSTVGWGVSADGLGNVYLSGSTSADLDGPNSGSYGEPEGRGQVIFPIAAWDQDIKPIPGYPGGCNDNGSPCGRLSDRCLGVLMDSSLFGRCSLGLRLPRSYSIS